MKRFLAVFLIAFTLCLSACEKENETEVQPITTTTTTTTITEASDVITEKTAKTYKTTTTTEETTTERVDNSTVKETIVTYKTEKTTYQLTIDYKNISDLKAKAKNYTSLSKLLKQGKISVKDNSNCLNPFSEQGLSMIFEDKKVVIPVAVEGYTLKSVSLSSNRFFNYIYTDKDKNTCALRIYTSIYEIDQNTSNFALSFTDDSGNDIYKNSNGNYCWFLDDKYVALFTGNDKSFINGIRYTTVNIK